MQLSRAVAYCAVPLAFVVVAATACERQPQVGLKTLTELCEAHPTDKCPFHHNYVEIYETLFQPLRDQPIRLLEIGVLEGHSMRLWEAYFPSARIFGIDIVDRTQDNSARIQTFVADQGNREALATVVQASGGQFDVILDDGGHQMQQQQVSFGSLFSALKTGGLYIIEDIHTSFPDRYAGFGVEPDGQNSTYAMIDRFAKTLEIRSPYLTPAEHDYLKQHVAYCSYYVRANPLHSDLYACWKK